MKLVATYPALCPPAEARTAAERNGLVLDLFHSHADGVFRMALAMLGRRAEAEDVVQETFLRLLRHVAAGRPLPNARGWIFTVAAHGCRDQQRSSRRWLPWLASEDRRQSPDRPDLVDAARSMETAISRLSSRDRLLIALRAEGLSYQEIAAAARLRGTSVGRTVTRALERLARELDTLGARP